MAACTDWIASCTPAQEIPSVFFLNFAQEIPFRHFI
jgi:hypothetical protein